MLGSPNSNHRSTNIWAWASPGNAFRLYLVYLSILLYGWVASYPHLMSFVPWQGNSQVMVAEAIEADQTSQKSYEVWISKATVKPPNCRWHIELLPSWSLMVRTQISLGDIEGVSRLQVRPCFFPWTSQELGWRKCFLCAFRLSMVAVFALGQFSGLSVAWATENQWFQWQYFSSEIWSTLSRLDDYLIVKQLFPGHQIWHTGRRFGDLLDISWLWTNCQGCVERAWYWGWYIMVSLLSHLCALWGLCGWDKQSGQDKEGWHFKAKKAAREQGRPAWKGTF